MNFPLIFEGPKWPHPKISSESPLGLEILADHGLDDHVSYVETFSPQPCSIALVSFLLTRPFDLPDIGYSAGECIADTASPTTIERGPLTVPIFPTSKGMELIRFDIPTSCS